MQILRAMLELFAYIVIISVTLYTIIELIAMLRYRRLTRGLPVSREGGLEDWSEQTRYEFMQSHLRNETSGCGTIKYYEDVDDEIIMLNDGDTCISCDGEGFKIVDLGGKKVLRACDLCDGTTSINTKSIISKLGADLDV